MNKQEILKLIDDLVDQETTNIGLCYRGQYAKRGAHATNIFCLKTVKRIILKHFKTIS
jgi:hypothetical protein